MAATGTNIKQYESNAERQAAYRKRAKALSKQFGDDRSLAMLRELQYELKLSGRSGEYDSGLDTSGTLEEFVIGIVQRERLKANLAEQEYWRKRYEENGKVL